ELPRDARLLRARPDGTEPERADGLLVLARRDPPRRPEPPLERMRSRARGRGDRPLPAPPRLPLQGRRDPRARRALPAVRGAHGTGTAVGDPIEVEALLQAFGAAPTRACALGSVKSNFGHLGEAAGMAGFLKAVLALQHREIPGTLHFEEPNPRIAFEGSPF